MIDFPASPVNGQLFVDPTTNLQWVWDGTKWLASAVSAAYLPLAGGTMTGPIVLAADPAAAMQPATKQYVDLKAPIASPTFTGTLTSGGLIVPQAGIAGVTDGSSAASGRLGEYVIVNSGATSPASGAWATLSGTQVNLSPGDWDIDGNVVFGFPGSNGSQAFAGIGTALSTAPGTNAGLALTQSILNNWNMRVPRLRVSIATATNYFLNVFALFASGTCTVSGSFTARRIR